MTTVQRRIARKRPARRRMLRAASSAVGQLTAGVPVAGQKPLWAQYQRIGGGLTPQDVSWIMQAADGGQPQRLVDLGNESRLKDGHLHGVMATRDMAVSLYPLEFLTPEDAPREQKEAKDLCSIIHEQFIDFRGLVKHLTRSYFPGHAHAVLEWRKMGRYILPWAWRPIQPRDMFFAQDTGALRYQTQPGDLVGLDLQAEFPGRIISLTRSIMGTPQPQEGLIRLLVWMALFRNWDLRDWIALAEIGWKPWRTAKYAKNTTDEQVADILSALEMIGSTGVGVFPVGTEFAAEWPKSSGGVQGGQHQQLFDAMGREISKATLGQTTSTESGSYGTRGDTAVRDQIRKDIGEDDALAVAAALHWQLFAVAVAVNLGPAVPMPATWFQTEEATDRKEFASAIKQLADARLRMPSQWIRGELGMPEPKDDEETIGGGEPVDESDPNAPGQAGKPDEKDDSKLVHDIRTKAEQTGDGPEYADRVNTAQKAAGARELAPLVGNLLSLVDEQRADTATDDRTKLLRLRDAMVAAYADEPAPEQLAENLAAGLTAARLAGMAAVKGEDGGEPDDA
ncbi:MAG: phage portal protein family protein [Candidatus Deferrimicrobiaceae bacterium]